MSDLLKEQLDVMELMIDRIKAIEAQQKRHERLIKVALERRAERS